MESNASNVERLQEGGVIIGELPEAYVTVIERLSTEEVDAILETKRRLDDAYESSAAEGIDYRPFFVPL